MAFSSKQQQTHHRAFPLWRTLQITAVLIILLVLSSMAVDAYTLGKAFVWVTDRVLHLTWDEPEQTVDHYRIEVVDTDLLADPVTSSQYFTYARRNEFSQELSEDHSYLFRVQGVTPYGSYSPASDSTSLYIVEGGQTTRKLAETQPTAFSLSQNYPNPFNSSTAIHYQVPGAAGSIETTMTIYNILGQEVRKLVNNAMPPGQYTAVWDGRDESGNEVSSGHYLYLLTSGKHRMSKKMLLMK